MKNKTSPEVKMAWMEKKLSPDLPSYSSFIKSSVKQPIANDNMEVEENL